MPGLRLGALFRGDRVKLVDDLLESVGEDEWYLWLNPWRLGTDGLLYAKYKMFSAGF